MRIFSTKDGSLLYTKKKEKLFDYNKDGYINHMSKYKNDINIDFGPCFLFN